MLENASASSHGWYAAPPYSWTRARALKPLGVTSSICPSARRRTTTYRPASAGRRIRDHGFKRILFTDIPRAGDASPDFQTARILAQSARVPLWMGGTIQSMAHLKLAMDIPGVQGVAVDALRLLDDSDLLDSLNLAHI